MQGGKNERERRKAIEENLEEIENVKRRKKLESIKADAEKHRRDMEIK
jgi:hypothetical protein